MPRQEFRTIEAFVLWLDMAAVQCNSSAVSISSREGHSDARLRLEAKRDVYQEIADLVRNSNLGIVYPPEGG